MIGTPDILALISVIRDPALASGLSEERWNELLLMAREHALIARLGVELERCGLLASAPAKARSQLRAAAIACESTHTAIRFELDRALRALEHGGVDVPLIVLKGAGYLVADLPAARGRFIGDLDLMVPLERIEAVEEALIAKGWEAGELDAYDQHYYRQWMHEVPPLEHPERQTPIDLHHTILPRTARARPDAAALHAAAVPLPGGRIKVLAPPDMLLHGAVHLFHGESTHPLRDLFDQRDLMRHFSATPGFWQALLEHARLHDLGRSLFYALRYAQRLLDAPVPEAVIAASAAWRPPAPQLWLMDRLFLAHLLSVGAGGGARMVSLANLALYIRSHWLKMPPLMLARHLTIKAWKRFRERGTGQEEAREAV